MRTVGYEQFPVCDFCEIDRSGSQTQGKVFPLGEKGICKTCLETLASLLIQNTGMSGIYKPGY